MVTAPKDALAAADAMLASVILDAAENIDVSTLDGSTLGKLSEAAKRLYLAAEVETARRVAVGLLEHARLAGCADTSPAAKLRWVAQGRRSYPDRSWNFRSRRSNPPPRSSRVTRRRCTDCCRRGCGRPRCTPSWTAAVAESSTRRRPTRITPAMAAHAAMLAAGGRTAADIAGVLGCSPNGALNAIRRGGGTPAGPGRRPTPVPDAVADALVLAYAVERSLVRAVAAVNASIGSDVPQLTTSIARRVLQDRGVPLGAPRRTPAGVR